MDKFPGKVAVGVFLTAFMPDTQHKPSYVLDKHAGTLPTAEELDRRLSLIGSKSILSFSNEDLSDKFYQLSPIEDLELAKTLTRPGSLFLEDLTRTKNFYKEGYGSVPRSFIICNEDLAIPLELQRWMIQNAGIDYKDEIKGADHMAVLSKTQEVYDFC
ncbi:hypothetical protein L6164_001024 [Bauhinia variegata]|uniref:Uncharacterized protein n=1 Tax=Bauhinia variegata TaxID=167791 RepID=A0ACB9Q8I5_BAUVA|nr:hypothetical protein L6164_001024 [Bauhinia variegata]